MSALAYFSGCVVHQLEYGESCLQGVPIEKSKPAENSPGSCDYFTGFRCKLLFCPFMSVVCCSHHKPLKPWGSGYIVHVNQTVLVPFEVFCPLMKWQMEDDHDIRVTGAGPPQVKSLQEPFFKMFWRLSKAMCKYRQRMKTSPIN